MLISLNGSLTGVPGSQHLAVGLDHLLRDPSESITVVEAFSEGGGPDFIIRHRTGHPDFIQYSEWCRFCQIRII